MDQCKDELIDMEKELIQLRRDGETKTMQLNQLGITLEQLQSEVNKKTNQGNLVYFTLKTFSLRLFCFCFVYMFFPVQLFTL